MKNDKQTSRDLHPDVRFGIGIQAYTKGPAGRTGSALGSRRFRAVQHASAAPLWPPAFLITWAGILTGALACVVLMVTL